MRFKRGKSTLISSVLNIIGLSFAFAALYIILVQVHRDLTFNRDIKDSDRVYLVTSKSFPNDGSYSPYLNRPVTEALLESSSFIESGGIASIYGSPFDAYLDENSDPVIVNIALYSKDAPETLGFELIEGSWDGWINEKTIALSEKTAKKLGVHSGDNIKMGNRDFWYYFSPVEVPIVAIYKDLPRNTDFSNIDGISNIGTRAIEDYSQWNWTYFVKVQPGMTPQEVQEAFREVFKKVYIENGQNADKIDEYYETSGYYLFPVSELYFSKTIKAPGASGNKTTTFTLLGIAILIIIIAFINYINFFFALIPVRIKGINTRKILGSSRTQLILSMVGESVIFVLISFIIGAIVVEVFIHSDFSDIVSSSVEFSRNWGMVMITLGVGILISIVASLYPAFYITSFNPAFAIKGSMGSIKKGNVFRNTLIGFQFFISIVLIICAIFVNLQRRFMLNHELGFDKENLLSVPVSLTAGGNHNTIENMLRSDSAVKDVTWAAGPMVSDGRMGWGRGFNGEPIYLQCYPVSWNFLQFMGIPVIEGRDFEKSDEEVENGVFIMNKGARDNFGIKIGDRIGGHLDDDHPAEVVGFTDNFNYKSLRNESGPFCFYIFGKHPWSPPGHLFVRIHSGVDPLEVKDKIKRILSEVDPERKESTWDVELFDESLEDIYYKEKKLSQQINLFTLLAIIISLMGEFGLVMFETEYRRKEIGIRRVNGANVGEILLMFNTKFIKIVLLCFLVSIPISWWIVKTYLETYPYRTPVEIWVFLVALLAVLAVSVAVVTLRSYRAATINPMKSLRME